MNKNKLGEGGRNEKGIQGEETAYANVLKSSISKELREVVYVWIVRSVRMVHQKDRGEDPNQANKVGQREVELSPLRDQYWGQGRLQRNDCRIVSHQS